MDLLLVMNEKSHIPCILKILTDLSFTKQKETKILFKELVTVF